MSYRSTRACRILLCDTSLNLPRFLSIKSRRSSKLCFSLLSSILDLFRVTKRSANSSVWTVMGIQIIASRFSVTRNLTCKGFSSSVWFPEYCSNEVFSFHEKRCPLAANVSSRMRPVVTWSIRGTFYWVHSVKCQLFKSFGTCSRSSLEEGS